MNSTICNITFFYENESSGGCIHRKYNRGLDVEIGIGFQCCTLLRQNGSLKFFSYQIEPCMRITPTGRIRRIKGIDHFKLTFVKKTILSEVSKTKKEWTEKNASWMKHWEKRDEDDQEN